MRTAPFLYIIFLGIVLLAALIPGGLPGRALAQTASFVEPSSALHDAAAGEPAAKKTGKRKKSKKRSSDFRERIKTGPAPREFAGLPPPPEGKGGYDPSVTEPGEAITAIKNRAATSFWRGRAKPMRIAPRSDSAPPPLAPQGLASLERTSASLVCGVTFDDQPLRMAESDTFRRAIDTVAFELKRPCRAHEYLGWPLAQSEQDRVDRIFGDTIAKLRLRGFSIQPQSPAAAGTDVSVFTADRMDGIYNRHVLGLWSAGDAGLLLLMCETDVPAAAAQHAGKEKAQKKKEKKKKVKKKKRKRKKKKIAPKPRAGTSAPGVDVKREVKKEAGKQIDAPAPAAPEVLKAQEGKPRVMPGVAPAEEPVAPASTAPEAKAKEGVEIDKAMPAALPPAGTPVPTPPAAAPALPEQSGTFVPVPPAPPPIPAGAAGAGMLAAPPATLTPSAPVSAPEEKKAGDEKTGEKKPDEKDAHAADADESESPSSSHSGVQTISYDDPPPPAAAEGGKSALAPGSGGKVKRSFSGEAPAPDEKSAAGAEGDSRKDESQNAE